MRHVNYSLKPVVIDNAKPREKAYSLTDGGGLLVEVLPSGSKVWRFKYHLDGRREKVTLGSYPALTLKGARDRHEELRAMVDRGESPAKTKRVKVAEVKQAQAAAVTFRAFSGRWVDETLFYRSATYRAQIVRWLDAYVYPRIGAMELGAVAPSHILPILEGLLGTPTTADRVRVIIQQIYNFAVRKLLVQSNPAAPLKGAVRVPPKTHHRHLGELELGAFWRALSVQGAHFSTIIASRLLMLTMVRKGELLRARWSEFDLDAEQWDLPAARMKMKKPHRVFLSAQALVLLRDLAPLTGPRDGEDPSTVYVLPSIFRRGTCMGDATLNHFFKRLDFGVPEFSPHGTRGTAATLLREHGFGRDAVELLLAHAEADSSVAAYSHMELVPERKRAMQFLADRVDRLAAGAEVVRLHA
jgi:integrase